MKIALDARALTRTTIRGIAIYQYYLAKEFIRLGHTVYLLVGEREFFLGPPSGAKIVRVKGQAGRGLRNLIWSQVSLRKILSDLPIDVYHATDNDKLPAFLGVPKVVTIHDITPLIFKKDYYDNWDLSSKISFIINLMINKYFSNAVITVSNASKKDLINHLKFDPHKITVIYNGIPPLEQVNIKQGDAILKKFGIGGPYFVYIGGLEKRKNLPAIIKAFKIFTDVYQNKKYNFVIAGLFKQARGAEEANETYNELINLMKSNDYDSIRDRIIFTGSVSESEKSILLSRSDALVYPSFYEGFGIPPIEAMRLEVPVITSHKGGLIESCGKAAIYVDPYKPEEISSALVKIATDSKYSNLLKRKGLIQANKFSWEKAANQTLAVYTSLMNK